MTGENITCIHTTISDPLETLTRLVVQVSFFRAYLIRLNKSHAPALSRTQPLVAGRSFAADQQTLG